MAKAKAKLKRKTKTKVSERGARRDTTATIEKIMSVAIRIFADKGYEGTSIKELCREAKVNVAAIHYHFESKENLYRAVLSRFGGPAFDSAIRALQAPSNLEEFRSRLVIFLTEIITASNLQPELSLMIIRDMQTHAEILGEMFDNTFGRIHEAVVEFIRGSQQRNLIDAAVPLDVAVGTLHAQVSFVVLNRFLIKRRYGIDVDDAAQLQTWVHKIVELYLNGVKKRG